ncbi:hypothetical protein FRC12_002418 [Ceratobasidium sp. 428]|nr:hypothetical protein FRC12_002418 [Ceratobasidium sp. 428]
MLSLIETSPARHPESIQPVFLRLVAQTLPADILIIIFEILVLGSRTEVYTPLICSHVCAHWRQTVVSFPSLWSYIDTSRGEGLTHLWLLRSKTAPIDVRFWGNPLDCDLMRGTNHLPQPIVPTSRIESIIEFVYRESYRWRSLDIAFCDMRLITRALEFLKWPSSPLHLGSLTIGPMGSTELVSHECLGQRPIGDDAIACPDIAAARFHFEKLNVSCNVLRIDTYPTSVSPNLFSSRLTVLEVFFGDYGRFDSDHFAQWRYILSQTPNLVDLRLKSFRYLDSYPIYSAYPTDPIYSTGTDDSPFELPVLERLELAGGFVWFIRSLGEEALFPRLEFLSLTSPSVPRVLGLSLASIASIRPPIRQLRICAGALKWCGDIFQSFHLLQEVTFLEMSWKHVIMILGYLVGLPGLLHIRLEHIWDMNIADPRFKTLRPRLPSLELVGCLKGDRTEHCCSSECICESKDASNYSDNSSFSGISHLSGYPSSEETGSNESERSYGEAEDLDFATPT